MGQWSFDALCQPPVALAPSPSPAKELRAPPVVASPDPLDAPAKRSRSFPGPSDVPYLPSEVWSRVLEYLATRQSPHRPCEGCHAIVDTLEALIAGYSSVSSVCRAWRDLTSAEPFRPETWHSAVFGVNGTRENLLQRLELLQLYVVLMKGLHGAPAKQRHLMKDRIQEVLQGMLGLPWSLKMEVRA
jgi:hypothetical protein